MDTLVDSMHDFFGPVGILLVPFWDVVLPVQVPVLWDRRVGLLLEVLSVLLLVQVLRPLAVCLLVLILRREAIVELLRQLPHDFSGASEASGDAEWISVSCKHEVLAQFLV